MIDELVTLAIVAAIDVKTAGAASKHRWLRLPRAPLGLFFLAAVTAGIYVTFRYS
ncbi:hypothetical protein [Azonexus sp.]|uniref:hypothetical protein n=1 Tax=Azonexus sp. TaxID=1872668 RepID=UPI0035AF8C68